MLKELFLHAGGRTGCTRFGIVLLLLSCICTVGIADIGDRIIYTELAPLNPDFVWMVQNPALLYQSGIMPSPIYQSHQKLFPDEFGLELYPIDLAPGDSERLPASFNLRQDGRVSYIIGDQGSCDAGWAFASLGSLLSSIFSSVRSGAIEPFSQNHLKNTNGFDLGACGGGNADIATAYLARGSGPVSAYEDPYSPDETESPDGLEVTAHLKRTLVIPMADDPGHPSIIDLIKRIIMNEGAVYGAYYADDQFYQNSSLITTYYNPHPIEQTKRGVFLNATGTYQGVLLVGWDDSIKRTDFAVAPPSNGAFLVQNSYGREWGMDGYFYLSYYDAAFNQMNPVAFTASGVNDYDNIYQYDPLGYTQSYGEAESYAFANIFHAKRDEVISAVGFYCTNPNAYYTIEVYASSDYLDLEIDTPISVQTGYEGLSGYYTIQLVDPVPIKKYDFFAVVIRMTTPGRWYPVAVEVPIEGYSSGATAVQGQSYVSKDGVTWEDFALLQPHGNVCLKVFTTSSRGQNMAFQNEMEKYSQYYPLPNVPNEKYEHIGGDYQFVYNNNQLSDVIWQ